MSSPQILNNITSSNEMRQMLQNIEATAFNYIAQNQTQNPARQYLANNTINAGNPQQYIQLIQSIVDLAEYWIFGNNQNPNIAIQNAIQQTVDGYGAMMWLRSNQGGPQDMLNAMNGTANNFNSLMQATQQFINQSQQNNQGGWNMQGNNGSWGGQTQGQGWGGTSNWGATTQNNGSWSMGNDNSSPYNYGVNSPTTSTSYSGSSRGSSMPDHEPETQYNQASANEWATPTTPAQPEPQPVMETNMQIVITKQNANIYGVVDAPIYFADDGKLVLSDTNTATYEEHKEPDVDYATHRTDVYLKNRGTKAPDKLKRNIALAEGIKAASLTVEQFKQQEAARLNAITNDVDKDVGDANYALTLNEPLFAGYEDQDFTKVLTKALKDQGLESVIENFEAATISFKIMRQHKWIAKGPVAERLLLLKEADSLHNLVIRLIELSNVVPPAVWKFIHDEVTSVFNELIFSRLNVRVKVDSIVSDWNDITQYMGQLKDGIYVPLFNNLHSSLLTKCLTIAQLDSTDKENPVKEAWINCEWSCIKLPVSSNDFTLAKATTYGRVLQSVTPRLYEVIKDFYDPRSRENVILTNEMDAIHVYGSSSSGEGAFFIASPF